MSRIKVGERAFAVLDGGAETIRVLGFGTYEGHCEPDIKIMGIEPGEIPGFTNPKIQLDNGDAVWGAECWWGPMERFEEFRKGRKIETVDIKEFRK